MILIALSPDVGLIKKLTDAETTIYFKDCATVIPLSPIGSREKSKIDLFVVLGVGRLIVVKVSVCEGVKLEFIVHVIVALVLISFPLSSNEFVPAGKQLIPIEYFFLSINKIGIPLGTFNPG